jgi:hypothetical protein
MINYAHHCKLLTVTLLRYFCEVPVGTCTVIQL